MSYAKSRLVMDLYTNKVKVVYSLFNIISINESYVQARLLLLFLGIFDLDLERSGLICLIICLEPTMLAQNSKIVYILN